MLNPVELIKEYDTKVFEFGKWKGKTFEWVYKYHPEYAKCLRFNGYRSLGFCHYKNGPHLCKFSNYISLISQIHILWTQYITNLYDSSDEVSDKIRLSIDYKAEICHQIHEIVPKLNLMLRKLSLGCMLAAIGPGR